MRERLKLDNKHISAVHRKIKVFPTLKKLSRMPEYVVLIIVIIILNRVIIIILGLERGGVSSRDENWTVQLLCTYLGRILPTPLEITDCHQDLNSVLADRDNQVVS